jgi:hypothetical protein
MAYRSDLPGTLLTIALVVLAAWLLDLHHALDGERFLYPAVCEMLGNTRTCTAKPGGEIGYKVSEDGRSVTLWSPSVLLTRLDGCTVRDSKNWSCTYLEMRDGEITNGAQFLAGFTSHSDAYPLAFVPKWRWQAAKFGFLTLEKPPSWP